MPKELICVSQCGGAAFHLENRCDLPPRAVAGRARRDGPGAKEAFMRAVDTLCHASILAVLLTGLCSLPAAVQPCARNCNDNHAVSIDEIHTLLGRAFHR